MPRFEPHPSRRAAVVTGASSGIGRATATALAAAGHPVVLGARRVDRCEVTAAEIRATGGEALALPLDLLDGDAVASFAKVAEQEMGPIEVLVSNAGVVRPAATLDLDPDVFLAQLNVNLAAAQRVAHHFGPAMVAHGRGDIVMVSSDVVRTPRPLVAAYIAAKAGLEGLARALQMELEGTGVRVGIIRPGPASTEQGTDWPAELVDMVMNEWARWGLLRHPGYLRPRDVAAAVVAMVCAPRGTQFTLLEVQPEAPA